MIAPEVWDDAAWDRLTTQAIERLERTRVTPHLARSANPSIPIAVSDSYAARS